MLEYVEQRHEQHEEEEPYAQDVGYHVVVENECRPLSRRHLHDVVVGRQCRQRKGGKGVHDEVYPEQLSNRQRRLRAHERAEQYYQTGTYVHRQLEQQETLYVLVQTASPFHGMHYRRERVVQNRYVADVFRHLSATAHRYAHMRLLQRRSVVGAVARNSHDVVSGLQGSHKPSLVHRTGTRDNLNPFYAAKQLPVGHLRKVAAVDNVFIFGLQAYLPAYLARSSLSVAGNNLYVDAGVYAASDRLSNIGAHRVFDTENAKHAERFFSHQPVGNLVCIGTNHHICQSQGAHAATLPLVEFFCVVSLHVE